MIGLACIIVLRFGVLYTEYQDFVHKPFYYTEVEVLQQYTKTKANRTYTILHVQSEDLGLSFFTKTYTKKNLLDKRVRLKLFPSHRITFVDYLSTLYIKSEINALSAKPPSVKSRLLDAIAQQHEIPMMTQFYQAIFFAHPLPRELRTSISTLGISHLIALSGFHLAILSGVLFFLLRPLYRWTQQRYFPYRYDLLDVGFVVLVLLGGYVWFVDAPDSLLRSYMMMLFGWVLLLTGMELLSFSFLATIVMVLLVLVPEMLFSLAFWFSVMGVFYIFLLLYYFQGLKSHWMTLLISVGVFVLMMPIVHLFFPITSPLQLISPLLSLGFSLFYPLSMAMHGVGWGAFLDEPLSRLFTLPSQTIEQSVSLMSGIGYGLLSLAAIHSRGMFYLLLITAFGALGWMFIPFMV
ncbi:MAG TPA: ComEC/Rec2 family competence protein [Campylobacterales bacterium]|nr:ComEC/Rec2 family competence protein [Campylobacterales bacterium]